MNKIISVATALVLLSGCAYKSDAYLVGKDTYTISGSSDYGFAGARNQAMKGASQTCTKLGKYMQIKNTSQHQSYLFWTVDIIFLCISDNDQDYQRTQMRKDNGVNDINLNIKHQ